MVAQMTLTHFVRVRILLPLPRGKPVVSITTGSFCCLLFVFDDTQKKSSFFRLSFVAEFAYVWAIKKEMKTVMPADVVPDKATA